MNKKYSKYVYIFIIVVMVGIVTLYATRAKDYPNGTYIIGTQVFQPGTEITTEKIMLGAKSVKGENIPLEDMIIYFKNDNGKWIDYSTGKLIPKGQSPIDLGIIK